MQSRGPVNRLNCLLVAASLSLAACSSAVPKVAVEAKSPTVAPTETAYLVWARTDVGETSTYETVMISSDGDVIARRPGVFIAKEDSLFEVRITQQRLPSLACKMDLWDVPRADLAEGAFEDQIIENAEMIDVASGEHRAPIESDPIELSTNDQGIALDSASRSVRVVGSLGTSVSFVVDADQWPCGTMHVHGQTVHSFDASTGHASAIGPCSSETRTTAAADLLEQAGEFWKLDETTCAGVTVEVDENHRYVANHRFQSYASPELGSNGTLFTSEQKVTLAGDYDTDMPVAVGIWFDAHRDARGFSTIDSSVARGLFVR